MQVTETLNEGLARGFTVTVPAKLIEARIEQKLNEIGETVKIPGFRSGKVPMQILRQRYKGQVLGEVINETVAESSTQALSERDLRPAMQPKIEITSFEPEKSSDLVYSMDVELLPEINDIDLSKLKLTNQLAEVADKDLDEAMDMLASNNKIAVAIKGKRAAKIGDVLLIDFAGTCDGEPHDGMQGTDHELELGSNSFIGDFEEQLIGLKAGADKVVKVTFPTEYHAEELAGKDAEFKVDVKEIREHQLPELNDEFAKKLGMEKLDELREAVKGHLKTDLDKLSRDIIKRDLLDLLADEQDFEGPKGMIDQEFEQIWQNVKQAEEKGELPDEDVGKDEDTLKAEYREIAERRVCLGLLFSHIGQKAKVDVSQEEVTQAILAEARNFPGDPRQIYEYYQKNPQAMAHVKAPLYENKVVDYILEMATVTDKTVTVEALKKAAEAPETKKPAKKNKKKTTAKKAAPKKTAPKKAKADKETAS